MKKFIRISLKISLLALSLCGASTALYAESEKSTTISPWAYKQLNKAEQLIAKQEYAKARTRLEKVLAEVKKNSYAQAIALRSLGAVYALENKHQKATSLLEQALATQALNAEQQQEALLNLGQLYMAIEHYKNAVAILEPWLVKQPDTTNTQVRVLLANAYAQLKQYRKALPYIEHVIKHAKKPKASWLQLNLALYYELENYPQAAIVLRRLISLYPDNKDYWQQLTSIYQQLQQYERALTINNLAYNKGFLASEPEIIQLFNLFLYNKQPYQAASLLARELDAGRVKSTAKNWELLASAWTTAREYTHAINALEQASTLHDKGDLYLQLGRIHVEQEKWQDAVVAIKKALKKGGLKQTEEAYILLGISYFESGQLKSARSAFDNAMKYAKTRKSAQQWLKFISSDVSS